MNLSFFLAVSGIGVFFGVWNALTTYVAREAAAAYQTPVQGPASLHPNISDLGFSRKAPVEMPTAADAWQLLAWAVPPGLNLALPLERTLSPAVLLLRHRYGSARPCRPTASSRCTLRASSGRSMSIWLPGGCSAAS